MVFDTKFSLQELSWKPAYERRCTDGEKRHPRPHQRLHDVLQSRCKERVDARHTRPTLPNGTLGHFRVSAVVLYLASQLRAIAHALSFDRRAYRLHEAAQHEWARGDDGRV